MKATCWHGVRDVRVEQVPDPGILNPGDAIVRITSIAICGSDLHLYNGVVPGMMQGDILGHEFMGEIVEIGASGKRLTVGERVVVPFPIACGQCFFCEQKLFSVCENANPNAYLAPGSAMCSAICKPCLNACSTAKSIRPASSRITSTWMKRRGLTPCSSTSRITASRSSCILSIDGQAQAQRVAVSCLCTDSINFRYHQQGLLLHNLGTYTANQPNLQCVSQTG
ncbi:alcohol dehydrogenase catalytic domain-containing protein [Massilia sp. DJPM01]|uniref:alcohol dehydrogenase catalytic domain-containing protein n=1 Tax=Massilia sp. DJPM01 TaxID=3024404 RepID=UPI00259F3629|nr:alcohol dehydrogenase catalytic domain-containing protein [Massilia sp. DJPM01]MDM5176021.1 alcohol dehydrogenase catalytic domain-containing protein [Massilia sp. DJPM01]